MWAQLLSGCLAGTGAYLALGGDLARVRLRQALGGLARLRARTRELVSSLELGERARRRRRADQLCDLCERQMPELLDMLALGLSAGLSFDAALELYCQNSAGELSGEVRLAMRSWQMGIEGRSEALGALAARVGSASLGRFCAAVREALSFGAPLAATLERQADAIRAEQRSRVQERIEEVPVKMLVPLGTLVVPAMLLAILGPLLSAAVSM